MRKFLLKLSLWALPFVLFLGIVGGIALYSGEAMGFSMIRAMQQQNPDLIYNPDDARGVFIYKAMVLQREMPEVVMLGSSRSQQYRGNFFTEIPGRAYNAGIAGWDIVDIRAMVDYLSAEQPPAVLILALDQQQFYAEASALDLYQPVSINWNTTDSARFWTGTSNLFNTLQNGNVSLERLLSRTLPESDQPALGITALGFGDGYRLDGSRHLSADIRSSIEQRREGHWNAFRGGYDPYTPSSAVATNNIRIVEHILQLAAEQGTQVIGYFPPFAPDFYDAIVSSGKYTYMPDAAARLDALFTSYGFHFFDYSDSRTVGGTADELYDGYHPTERLQLRMHIAMTQALPDMLGAYSDLARLERALQSSSDPFDVVP